MHSQRSISGWKWRDYTNDFLHSSLFFEDTLNYSKPIKINLPSENQSRIQTSQISNQPLPKKIRTKLLSVQQPQPNQKNSRIKIISKAKFLSSNISVERNDTEQELVKNDDLVSKCKSQIGTQQISPKSLKNNSYNGSRYLKNIKSKTEQCSYGKDHHYFNTTQKDIRKQLQLDLNLTHQQKRPNLISRRKSHQSKQVTCPSRSARLVEPSRITVINLDQQNLLINKMYHQKYQDFIKCLYSVQKDFHNLLEQKGKFMVQNRKESVHNVKNFFYT